ncbi:hypothetical protein [Pelagibaculum spongiae]|uniref:Uncharacterized protein n=1 Tax=Pelagibaculum spongiae TaxID=2080658 RepID=A0A2V1H150_9GAMM|nr:hypothetical protein [Pelagibaculum spongiae]PVZ70152.1 hypothetical protein DC094_06000 [Pelagibaculum spongiae]
MRKPFYIFLYSTLIGLSLIALDNYGYQFDLNWLTASWATAADEATLSSWFAIGLSWLHKLVIPGTIALLWIIGRDWLEQDQKPKLRCIHNKRYIKPRTKSNGSKKKDFF